MKLFRTLVVALLVIGLHAATLRAQYTVDFAGNAALWSSQTCANLQAIRASVGPTLGADTRHIDALQTGAHRTAYHLNKTGKLAGYGATISQSPIGGMSPLSGAYGAYMLSPLLGMGGIGAMALMGLGGLPLAMGSMLPYMITMLPMELIGYLPMLASSFASSPTSGAVASQTAANLGTTPAGTQVGDGAYVRPISNADAAYMQAQYAGTPEAWQAFHKTYSPAGTVWHPITGSPIPVNTTGTTAVNTGGAGTTAPAGSVSPGTGTSTPPASNPEGTPLSRQTRPHGFRGTIERLFSFLTGGFLTEARAQVANPTAQLLGLEPGATPSSMALVTGPSAAQEALHNNFIQESNAAITSNLANANVNQMMQTHLKAAAASLARMQFEANALRSSLTETTAIPHVIALQRNIQNEQTFINQRMNELQFRQNQNNQILHGLLVQRHEKQREDEAAALAAAGSKRAAILSALHQAAQQVGGGAAAAVQSAGVAAPEVVAQ
ncbi:MAG: hypothetical protein AB7T14_08475 [Candidatus Methylacidiphilaceae bacterium]